ncbi:MAG: CocE/NonD family hydrolase [Burkholderiaceae bacterium]
MRLTRLLVAAFTVVALAAVALYAGRQYLPSTLQIRMAGLARGVWVDHSLRIRMPDGVQLAASVYKPLRAGGPLPTVLIRLPYGRLHYGEGANYGLYFAQRGYAVLVQDIRGKFDSGGEFAPWQGATSDGAATLDWIAAQSWSNGKVGTIGCSALGELQFALSRANHPAHAAMIPIDAGGGVGALNNQPAHIGFFEGGVLQLGSAFGWYLEHGRTGNAAMPASVNIKSAVAGLPTSTLVSKIDPARNAFDELWKNPLTGQAWKRFDFVSDADAPARPTLLVNMWGDQSIDGALAYAQLVARTTQGNPRAAPRVILAPGNHCQLLQTAQSGEFGDLKLENTQQPYLRWFLSWFDYWLKGQGEGLAQLPPYLYYVLGESKWLTANAWPPQEARAQRWHLGAQSPANSAAGGGTLTRESAASQKLDEWASDPANPVPSIGGPVCCTGDGADRSGPIDQAGNRARQDILVYQSAPLAQALRIAGPLKTTLTVSSTAKDTDLVARLIHVQPDGTAINVQEGALRLRYRESYTTPALLEPGKTYTVTVPMRSIAYYFPAGHRIRLDIASSNFPRLERNLQNGTDNPHQETQPLVARNRVFHGGGALSYLELPVIEGEVSAFDSAQVR